MSGSSVFQRVALAVALAILLLCQPIAVVAARPLPDDQAGLIGPQLNDVHIVIDAADSGAGSLRQAIADASSGDTISFALTYPATITLTSGELVITKSLTIAGPGAENLTVSGNRTSRVFYVSGSGIAVYISGLTVADTDSYYWLEGGGVRSDYATLTVSEATFSRNDAANGAGIYNSSGTLTVNDVTFSGNHASGCTMYGCVGKGGGIFNKGGRATVNSATFSNNRADAVGGGIASDGTLTVSNSAFSGNGAGSGWGGGISAGGAAIVRDSTFSGNVAETYGGGISANGTATVSACTFSGNLAYQTGGGMAVRGAVTVRNSTFSGNTAGWYGGGIQNEYGTLTVDNSTFSGNQAQYGGGGISGSPYNDAAVMTVTNSTFSGNTSGRGGGIQNGYSATLSLRNTIVANSGGGDCDNQGTIGQNLNNLVEDGSCSPLYSGDPNLGPLGDYGGDTPTHALLYPSEAIDHGDPATCLETDQRGFLRNGVCDIGAFEYNGLPYIFSTFLPLVQRND